MWGQGLWKLFQGLAPYIVPQHAHLADRLVYLFTLLLPCRYCRASWPEIVTQLIHVTGMTPGQHVLAGTFDRFVYDAHNLVNDKLARQRLETVAKRITPALTGMLTHTVLAALHSALGPHAHQLGPALSVTLSAALSATLSAAMPSTLLAAADATPGVLADLDKRPTFDCVRKRAIVADRLPFAPCEVWPPLMMMTIAHEPCKSAPTVELLQVLSVLVGCVSPDLAATAVTLGRAAAFLDAGLRRQDGVLDREQIFGVLALGAAESDGHTGAGHDLTTSEGRAAFLRHMHARIDVAEAGVCVSGQCI